MTDSTTVTGRDYLEKNIRKAINVSYEVTGHKAGIRPAMLDRRPCLGMHHKFPALAIFNGLGTKGALLSPYYARMMARCIMEKQEPETEVSIKRFERFYQEL